MDLQTARNFWQWLLYVGIGLGVVSGVLIFLGTWRGSVVGDCIDAEAPLQQPITLAIAKRLESKRTPCTRSMLQHESPIRVPHCA
jgi:hypothetical protein